MKQTKGSRFKAIVYTAAIAALLCIPFYLLAQCTDCDKRGSNIRAIDSGQEKESYDKRFAKISGCDPELDNPEDSTTKRIETLDNVVLIGFRDMSEERFEAFEKLLVDLILHDPYTAMRDKAVEFLSSRYFSEKVRLATFKQALNDPSIAVRVRAANALLENYLLKNFYLNPEPPQRVPKDTTKTAIPDQQAVKIIRDAAAGVGRSTWNVKGLYSKAQFEENPGIIESRRDFIQLFALGGLDRININNYCYIDSVSHHGKTEEIRKSAERVKKLLK